MLFDLPLKDMTLNEKFMAIETIWDDINHSENNFHSPAWHEQVLKERDARIVSGKDELLDWNFAKEKLRETSKCR